MSFDPAPQPPGPGPRIGAHPVPPLPVSPVRRRSPAAPWIGVGLTMVCLLTATSVMGAPAAPPSSGAARWLPPDGTRFAFSADGITHTVEWSQPAPHSLMQFNSPTFMTWASIAEVDWTTAAYLRVTSQRLDDGAAAEATGEDLWVVGEDGARTVAESLSGTLDTIWEPGRLDLPADLAAGAAWASEGEVAFRPPGGEWSGTTYHADYQAAAPTDEAARVRGCVVVTMNLIINQQELPNERTWCPGAGVVASQDSESTWTPAGSLPRLPLAEQPAFDWSRADELTFTDVSHSQPGVGNTTLSPVSTPGLLPNGSLVVANRIMPDLIALDPVADPPPVRWAARPGGTLTSAASFAGATVVTTSRRALVAYGPDGQT
ncbi:MAG: hypothetical protein KIT69_02665 [Propionibacteriaceae bacterium]|nr:hypothetical protein [Propionibacteriaceae bacterium]